jgi:ribosomal protein L25 (general stress protein Ctc)
MKELTRKILEAGLVDKHTAMAMEKWGNLERGSADIVGTNQVTKDTLQAFADDIANLFETEQRLKETVLDLEIDGEKAGDVVITAPGLRAFKGTWDEMMRLVIDPKCRVILGDVITVRANNSIIAEMWRIVEIESVYINDVCVAKKLGVFVP